MSGIKKSFCAGLACGIMLCATSWCAWQWYELRDLDKSIAFFKDWGKLDFSVPNNLPEKDSN